MVNAALASAVNEPEASTETAPPEPVEAVLFVIARSPVAEKSAPPLKETAPPSTYAVLLLNQVNAAVVKVVPSPSKETAPPDPVVEFVSKSTVAALPVKSIVDPLAK